MRRSRHSIPRSSSTLWEGAYLDCENGIAQVDTIVSQIARHLGLDAPSSDLLLWNLNDCDPGWDFEKLINETKPDWVIADPLKAFFPFIERDSKGAIDAYRILRDIMSRHHCAIDGVHHIRKPGEQPLWLDRGTAHPWFLQARGPRELINGCDVRIGVDRPSDHSGDDVLVIRGFRRVHGEIPLQRVVRVLDDDGEPQGFRALSGVEMLNNSEQQAAFARLAARFSFKEAKAVYGKGDQATSDFLKKCIGANILNNPRKGWYEKVQAGAQCGTPQPAPAAA